AIVACTPSPPAAHEGEGEGEGVSGEGEGVAGEGEGASGPIVEPGDPGPADVVLTARFDTERAPISALIYGDNGGGFANATLERSGGNRLTAYNWENNASNAGTDYCNQNDSSMGSASDPPANAFSALLDDAQARGTSALITVPMLDVVAADTNDLGDGGQGPPACIGDVENSGPDYLHTRFVANQARKGAAFSDPPDASDGVVSEDEMIGYVNAHWPGVPLLVDLDNEPDLWSSTHVRIHPDPVTYDELVTRTIDFASAVKDASPSATVLGAVSYGYNGYITLQDASDSSADGDFIDYFLDRMQAEDTAEARRIVDVLDLHWYPEATDDNGLRVSNVEDAQAADARVQAPRSLADASYAETSWIVDDYLGGPIDLLHTLQGQIDAHYPGTRLSFSEWNYGGGQDISGAVAVADVLGSFGRQGVFAATFFPLSDDEPYDVAALALVHAGLGSTSVHAETSDIARVSVYASDDPPAFLVIHRDDDDITASLAFAGPATASLTAHTLNASAITPSTSTIAATATNAFLVPLHGRSVVV
ncbi:MAG TPA: glycoside hydrolase family 44 protein, partial [Myxococcota bacterium]